MEGGNLDIPYPLAQLGFSACESTGLFLFTRIGRKWKSTLQLHVCNNKKAPEEEMREEAEVKSEAWNFSSVSRPLRLSCIGKCRGALVERAGISDTDPQLT